MQLATVSDCMILSLSVAANPAATSIPNEPISLVMAITVMVRSSLRCRGGEAAAVSTTGLAHIPDSRQLSEVLGHSRWDACEEDHIRVEKNESNPVCHGRNPLKHSHR